MPWVRFDDVFPIHRKVRGLSDPAFRLHAEAIFWCARNLTDGFVPAADLLDLASARRPLKFVPELVIRGMWHLADEVCDSKKCPAYVEQPSERDGWLLHDYFEYQPTKAQVIKEREQNAERQRRYKERHASNGTESHSESNAVSNAVSDASVTGPRPVPSRRDGSSLGDQSAGDQSVRTGARVREATRHLHERYGLTDQEAHRVITEVEARAREPIKHLVKYLRSMAEGDLADIANAAMDRYRPPLPAEPQAPPTLRAVPDPVEPGPVGADPYETGPAKARAAFLEAKRRKASS